MHLRAAALDASAGLPLLRVSDLAVAREGRVRLRDVSLDVGPAEIVAVFGAAGAGKTALTEALAGLRKTDAGAVSFRGRDVANRPAHEIAGLGLRYVPNAPRVFDGLTVREHVALSTVNRIGRDAARERRYAVERALACFPALAERAGQPASRLSAPERTALAIAQALAGRPSLILLDDPAGRVSAAIAEAMIAFLETVRGGGVAVLVADPPPYRALAIADRGYTLEGGTITSAGAGAALRRNLDGRMT